MGKVKWTLPNGQFALGPFEVNFATRRLLRENKSRELRPRAFRVLAILVQNAGHLVDYEHLVRDGWDGSQVSTHTINVTVCEVKVALQECGGWIRCRSGFGYQLDVPESENLLRLGQHFQNHFTRTGLEKALTYFQRAAVANGADVRPWELTANVYLLLGAFMFGYPAKLQQGFLEAHKRILSLGGHTTVSRSNQALARFLFEGNPAQAETELLELLREGAGDASIYARLTMVRMAMGEMDAAMATADKIGVDDMLVAPLAIIGTKVRLFRREFAQALILAQRVWELHPTSVIARLHVAESLEHLKLNNEAAAHYRHCLDEASDAPWIRAHAARFLASYGRTKEARETLDELEQRRETEYVDAYYLALLCDALQMRERTIEELKRAHEEKSYVTGFLPIDPNADALPKYSTLQRSV